MYDGAQPSSTFANWPSKVVRCRSVSFVRLQLDVPSSVNAKNAGGATSNARHPTCATRMDRAAGRRQQRHHESRCVTSIRLVSRSGSLLRPNMCNVAPTRPAQISAQAALPSPIFTRLHPRHRRHRPSEQCSSPSTLHWLRPSASLRHADGYLRTSLGCP